MVRSAETLVLVRPLASSWSSANRHSTGSARVGFAGIQSDGRGGLGVATSVGSPCLRKCRQAGQREVCDAKISFFSVLRNVDSAFCTVPRLSKMAATYSAKLLAEMSDMFPARLVLPAIRADCLVGGATGVSYAKSRIRTGLASARNLSEV